MSILNKFLIPASLACWFFGGLALAGGEVGNGGDSVFCDASGDNNLVGYFSLDFLLTYRTRNGNADVIDRSWAESSARISQLLGEKYPALGHSFDEFVAKLYNTDSLQDRIWHEASFGLEDISDERILRKLPPNCYRRNQAGVPEVIQSVVRVQRPEAIIYEFDPTILAELERNAPLQFSFLVVHEWLWDFTKDVQVIRDVDRLLHSSQLEAYTNPDDLVEAIANLGISLSRQMPVPVCFRPDEIRQKLEELAAAPCDQLLDIAAMEGQILSRQPAGSIGYPVVLSRTDIKVIKLGDFSGLPHAGFIDVSENALPALHAYNFAGLMAVETIYLNNNGLATIEPGSLLDLPALNYLTLQNNKLVELPKKFLANIRKTYRISHSGGPGLTINLRGNPMTTFPNDFCDGIEPQVDHISERLVMIALDSVSPEALAQLNQKFRCAKFFDL